jgi:predicted aminopeptidase
MKSRMIEALLLVTAAFAALTALPGCYYGHLAAGQTRLMWAGRSIDSVLDDPTTPDPLRSKLELVRAARLYARDLGLEVGDQYTTYVPWPGDRLVTTVVATRPAEVDPAGFWFPILGELPYKGFFDAERAEQEAENLRARGMDVCVSAVDAYSTLGWLDDPVTQPMLAGSDGRLVETIIHELVHATVFARDEPEFNESIATFVGQEAAISFFDDPPLSEAERARVRNARLLARALAEFRRRVVELYASPATDLQRLEQRAALQADFREELAQLPLEATTREKTRDLAQRVRLNDACLALHTTYSDDLERHADVFAELGSDLKALIQRLRRAAQTDDPRGSFLGDGAFGASARATSAAAPNRGNERGKNWGKE